MSMEEVSVDICCEDEAESFNPEEHHEEPQERQIKRRIRVGKKYHQIKNTNRKQLINRVESKGEKIIDVAKELGMKYSTAKSILKVYRSEGRTNKIPKSQRYLSLRVPDPDDLIPAEKIPINRRKKDMAGLEQNIAGLEQNIAGNDGPTTRLRSSKKEKKETVVTKIEATESVFKHEDYEEEAREPQLRKRLAKKIVPKIETQPINLKEESSLGDSCVAKKEDTLDSSLLAKDQDKAQGKTLSNELSTNEGLEVPKTHQPMSSPPILPDLLSSMMPLPRFNPCYLNPFSTDLAQIRLQNMAMYLQTLRLQTLLLNNSTSSLPNKFFR